MKLHLEWLLYRGLLLLLTPVALLWARLLDRRGEPGRWLERFGLYRRQLPSNPLWIHAASLGEAKAAALLIASMRKRGLSGPLLVTTTTATGAEAIQAVLHPGDRQLYGPFDAGWCVRRALDQIRPRALVVMEVELWPNLWRTCQRRGIPIILANARLSERSLTRYQRRFPRLIRDTLQRATLILAQSEMVIERYLQLGARPESLQNAGNLKFGLEVDPSVQQAGKALRAQLGVGRPLWLAASTHEGEEAIALQAHREVLEQHPDALLVLVPRHPQRFEEVAGLCAASGLRWARRSQPPQDGFESLQLYLADTLGELLSFYAAADLALVAGSFAPVGGHNILEPAAYGCPILVGPGMRNFEEILGNFLHQRALIQLASAEALGPQICALFDDHGEASRLADEALSIVRDNASAPERQADAILHFSATPSA